MAPRVQQNNNKGSQSNTDSKRLEERVKELEGAQYLGTVTDDIAVKDAVLEPLNRLAEVIAGMQQQQQHFMNYSVVNGLVPSGPFLSRFHGDHPDQKRSLSSYVASTFFSQRRTPQRCFIQASSTTLHLTQTLDSDPTVPDRCLIYTNSAVAHLPLLFSRSNGKHTIWPFCGKSFDPICAGWQIPNDDTESFDALRNLFERKQEPLKTAYLMPVFVTPDQVVFYEKSEAAQFANVLATAEEVVVLTVGNRILESEGLLHSQDFMHHKFYPALQNVAREKIKLVVAMPECEIPPFAKKFTENFGEVHWQSTKGWSVLG